jgi:hypothetical protein
MIYCTYSECYQTSPVSSKLIEQATRVHGQCIPDRRRDLMEEENLLSLMNGGTDLKSLERTEGNIWSLLKNFLS